MTTIEAQAPEGTLRCTMSGLWVRRQGSEAMVGVTKPLLEVYGPVAHIGLPSPGAPVRFGLPLGYVQTAAYGLIHLFPPVQGQLLEANNRLWHRPALLREDPYGRGWLVRIQMSNPAELDELMPIEAYEEAVANETLPGAARLSRELEERDEAVLLIGDQRQILAVNTAAEQLLGLSRERLQHRPLCAELFGCRRERGMPIGKCDCPGLKAMSSAEPVTDIYTVTNAAGRPTTVKARYEPLLEPGRPPRALMCLEPLPEPARSP